MPRVRYLKPVPGAVEWAEHVRHTSKEAVPDHDVIVTTMTPDGHVSVEVTAGEVTAEWFVGAPGTVAGDDELHDLAAEALMHGQEQAEAEAERARRAKDERRADPLDVLPPDAPVVE